jgi:phage gp29-like protein
LCAGFGENVWSYDKGLDLQVPRLKWWHPTHARWDWMERAFILQTQDAWQVKLPDLAEHPRGDGKWVQWMPNGGQYGWRRGLIRSLAHKYVVRQWNDVDWARFNERHGTPVLKAMVPSVSGNEEAERGFFERLADLGAETAIVLPQGDTKGTSYDAAWIELQGRNWESFQALKKDLGDEIAIAVLGQNLTTQVDGGSFAAATVHEGVELKKLAADAEIASALSDQLLSWFCHHNFGDANLAPRMVFKVVPEKDEAAEVGKDEGVTRVILGAQSVGLALDERAYAEKHGLPLLEEGDEELEEEPHTHEGEPSDEDEKKEAPPAVDDKAKAALAAGGNRKPKTTTDHPAVRYQTALERTGKAKLSKTIAVDVAAVQRVIASSKSFEEVSAKLTTLYKNTLDPASLAKLVERANILAKLNGRLGAVEDL